MFISISIVSTSINLFSIAFAESDFKDINTVLMENTFLIEQEKVLGTCFLVLRPFTDEPKRGNYVLVTANHVLEEMKGDIAVIVMRKIDKNGKRTKYLHKVKIRDNGKQLWTQHSSEDVAVMYLGIPKEVKPAITISSNLFSTDEILREFEIHPGDEVFCLGFPLGYFTSEGYPILRSGKIASYPLTPTGDRRTFLIDFRVFGGNSGGPVYFYDSNRIYKNEVNVGTIKFIMGIVNKQVVINETLQGMTLYQEIQHPLSLAVVTHANIIKETIELLPKRTSLNN